MQIRNIAIDIGYSHHQIVAMARMTRANMVVTENRSSVLFFDVSGRCPKSVLLCGRLIIGIKKINGIAHV